MIHCKAKYHHGRQLFLQVMFLPEILNQHHKLFKLILNLRKTPLVKHCPWGGTQRGRNKEVVHSVTRPFKGQTGTHQNILKTVFKVKN